jgi:hypothetical protein
MMTARGLFVIVLASRVSRCQSKAKPHDSNRSRRYSLVSSHESFSCFSSSSRLMTQRAKTVNRSSRSARFSLINSHFFSAKGARKKLFSSRKHFFIALMCFLPPRSGAAARQEGKSGRKKITERRKKMGKAIFFRRSTVFSLGNEYIRKKLIFPPSAFRQAKYFPAKRRE